MGCWMRGRLRRCSNQWTTTYTNSMWVLIGKADEYGWPTNTRARLAAPEDEQIMNFGFG